MLKIAGNKTLSSNSSILKYFSNSKYNYNFKNLKKFKKFNTILVIGMGGSILGSKAIYSFLKHRIKKKFIFVDNIYHQFLKEIKKKNKLYKTLFLIISKSGNTIETIVNSSFFTPFLKNLTWPGVGWAGNHCEPTQMHWQWHPGPRKHPELRPQ